MAQRAVLDSAWVRLVPMWYPDPNSQSAQEGEAHYPIGKQAFLVAGERNQLNLLHCAYDIMGPGDGP